MLMRRLRGEVGSSGTSGSRSARPTTRSIRSAGSPSAMNSRRLALARPAIQDRLE